jgi:hypothetical protein
LSTSRAAKTSARPGYSYFDDPRSTRDVFESRLRLRQERKLDEDTSP